MVAWLLGGNRSRVAEVGSALASSGLATMAFAEKKEGTRSFGLREVVVERPAVCAFEVESVALRPSKFWLSSYHGPYCLCR